MYNILNMRLTHVVKILTGRGHGVTGRETVENCQNPWISSKILLLEILFYYFKLTVGVWLPWPFAGWHAYGRSVDQKVGGSVGSLSLKFL